MTWVMLELLVDAVYNYKLWRGLKFSLPVPRQVTVGRTHQSSKIKLLVDDPSAKVLLLENF